MVLDLMDKQDLVARVKETKNNRRRVDMGKTVEMVEVTEKELENATQTWHGFVKVSKVAIAVIVGVVMFLGVAFTNLLG